MPKKTKPAPVYLQKVVLYRGPSLLDQAPIVVIGLPGSDNIKTGNMAQTYIIREDMHPMDANRTGEDYSICGNCPHRGTPNPNKASGTADNRSCYVALFQGPSKVYKAFQEGKYTDITSSPELIKQWGQGKNIRLGTYGDPAAVPHLLWNNLLQGANSWTGYSHQMKAPGAAYNPRFMMASADSQAQAQEFHAQGYRTFRVIPLQAWQETGKGSLLQNEVLCPASAESNAQGVTRERCKLCQGSSIQGKSIAIVAHGIGRKHHKGE